jgi:hypothetical protein
VIFGGGYGAMVTFRTEEILGQKCAILMIGANGYMQSILTNEITVAWPQALRGCIFQERLNLSNQFCTFDKAAEYLFRYIMNHSFSIIG